MTCGNTTASQLVIGDDYLVSNSRAIIVNVCSVTGMTVDATPRLGFSKGNETLTITDGSVVDAGNGIWVIRFNISRTDSEGLTPGMYDWSVELSQGGKEVTVAKSISYETKIEWVRKQT